MPTNTNRFMTSVAEKVAIYRNGFAMVFIRPASIIAIALDAES